MFENLLLHLLWKQGNVLLPLVLCDCRRDGIMPVGWVLFLDHDKGRHLRRGTSHCWLQDEGSVSVLWQSSPWVPLSPLLPALLMDTIPGRGAQKFSAIPLFLAYLYKGKCNSGWNEKHMYICAYTHTLQINAQHVNRTYYKFIGEGGDFYFLLCAFLNFPKF